MIPNQLVTKRIWLVLALAIGLLKNFGPAQTDSAKIVGYVTDRSGHHYIAGVTVELIDLDRGLHRKARTDSNGEYVFADVRPSTYRLEASATGFQTAYVPRIVVIVQDTVSQSFMLSPGDPSSTALQARSADLNIGGTVGSVLDTDLVSNLPLNGRSFQTLFQLIPGVVIAPTTFASQGQFSVNGQRTDANYFVVDGVSANFGIAGGVNPGQSAGGWLPALSVFGSTNSLVSTDDVQEFAVLTSSYSAEFGRVPGGQISIVTRSGTNKFAGSVFEYLRNDAFDANDWFANNRGLPRAALRQNDFGGDLGGPIIRDKTFFFASFEALELRQPTSSSTVVPSLMARNAAPSAVKPFLNAYPLPNGADDGNGLAQAIYGFSNPSSLEAVSFRLNHQIHESLNTFARFAFSTSNTRQRGAGSDALSTVTETRFGLSTLTGGIDYSFSARTLNDFRFNWSHSSAANKEELDSFGGAIPLAPQLLFPPGINSHTAMFQFLAAVDQQAPDLKLGQNVNNTQKQVNVLDAVSYQIHAHLIKAGIDFRQLSPRITPAIYEQQSFFPDIHSSLLNQGLVSVILSSVPVHADFRSYSLFSEDTWRYSPRLSVTIGMRWDFASTPTVRGANGLGPFAVTGFDNLPELSLAAPGTPLYRSSKANFAPRIGFAYELRRAAKINSVIKGGAGIYYDLSNGPAGDTLSALSFPFAAESLTAGTSLPLPPRLAAPPAITTSPPFSTIDAFPPSLRTPYSYHWNLSFDQAIGTAQTVSISYVGAAGHRLLRTQEYLGGDAGVPRAFTQVLLTDNSGYSNFSSLQLRFDRRAGPLYAIASYSLSRTLDNISTDNSFNGIPRQLINPRGDYGPSDFDIRHSANLGLDYVLPKPTTQCIPSRYLASGWSIDPIVMWRSSPPVNPVISREIGLAVYDFRPDLVPGLPFYLSDPRLPGGRMINPTVLSVPTAPRQGNLSRNFFRGFPFFQTDLAVRRSFRVGERTQMQISIEAFNMFNDPNFAPPAVKLGTVDTNGNFIPQAGFGISPATLAQSLQNGAFASGFNPLYQIGAARSVQLALKVSF